MSIIPMCFSNKYTHKLSVKTQHLYSIPTNSGLRVSTPSSHHQALLGTNPRTSDFIVHTAIPGAYKGGVLYGKSTY
jgi:hypothetical protein